MSNFDGVNFREHHSEEMISFFWRSVYNDNNSNDDNNDNNNSNYSTVKWLISVFQM